MNETEARLAGLYALHFDGVSPAELTPVAASGGNREYYRLEGTAGNVIGTSGSDLAENRAFIYLSKHFAGKGLLVPHVLAVSDCGRYYLQTDCGCSSLFDILADARTSGRFGEEDVHLLRAALDLLIDVQFEGASGIDFNRCYPQPAMNARMIAWDLNYFKYSFLKPALGDFDEALLQDDLDSIATAVGEAAVEADTFMVRDFQSRNLMVDDAGKLSLIDFQGGRRGPVEYDVASFLWQAKAAIPPSLRMQLVDWYVAHAERYALRGFSAERFRRRLPVFVLFRVLQTLGAYGFRGLYERRPHFIASIGPGVANLRGVISEFNLAKEYPYLAEIAEKLADCYAVRTASAISSVPPAPAGVLTVSVASFSYKKGVPADFSGNGGGFVFDCRAVHNPGRFDRYKPLTGRDAPVVNFLEENGEIFTFLESAYKLVDASVARYISRGFTSLCVSFGCTGGRHRSVYSAEAMTRHMHERFPQIRVVLWHREQDVLEIFNPMGDSVTH